MSTLAPTNGYSAKLAFGVSVGVGALSTASYFFYKYWKKDVMPANWRRVGTVELLPFFPVKSCAPLELSRDVVFNCEILGLRLENCRDRSLMLVDSTDQMITARVYPKLVLIKPTLVSPTKLEFNAPGMDTLHFDFELLAKEAPGKDVHTDLWGAKLDVMLCGEKFDKWFSKFILDKDSGLRLVYYPYPKPMKPIDKDLVKEPFITPSDTGTFTDATSYMLMNMSSIEDLNKRLSHPVKPLQFRGSFFLKMDEDKPYDEDNYEWIRVGNDAVFRKVAPCLRCILPNIDPDTGERNPDGEPLKTLKSYRSLGKNKSPTLGIHLGLRQAGKVKYGDVIYVGVK